MNIKNSGRYYLFYFAVESVSAMWPYPYLHFFLFEQKKNVQNAD